MDDFSSDGSIGACEKAIDGDSRVRLIRKTENSGPAAARNTIINESNGEFIVFFDDDDVSCPERVSVQLRTLTEYEAQSGAVLVACYAGGMRCYPNGYIKALPAIGSRKDSVPNGPALADYLLFYRRQSGWFYGSGVPACALMSRLSTFRKLGGFDPSLRRVEDADFAIRLALSGGHFVGTKEVLFKQYSTDAIDKSPEKNLESEQLLALKNKTYLEKINRFYYALHWPKLRYWHFKRRYGRFVLEMIGLFLRHPVDVTAHLFKTGPQRLQHESRMRRKD